MNEFSFSRVFPGIALMAALSSARAGDFGYETRRNVFGAAGCINELTGPGVVVGGSADECGPDVCPPDQKCIDDCNDCCDRCDVDKCCRLLEERLQRLEAELKRINPSFVVTSGPNGVGNWDAAALQTVAAIDISAILMLLQTLAAIIANFRRPQPAPTP
jgi:hypothetical protein